METNRNDLTPDRDDQLLNGEVRELFPEPDGSTNGETATERDEPHERRKHHEHHHIGRYRSFSNYSSAGSQPSTNTGPGLF